MPTPVERLPLLSTPDTELWVKRDDKTHDVYGGNKVRKLEWLLADACRLGARRIVTIGAVGSHHVLATTYFGKLQGLEVEAILVPQPATEHALDTLRAGLGLGLRAYPVRSRFAAPLVMMWRAFRGARVVPLGGSDPTGSMGYVMAARELAAQVRAGEMPEPDICVVALGSGGTAAGLVAGFEAEGLKTRVVGVCVAGPPWVLEATALRLARVCLKRVLPASEIRLASIRGRFSADARFLGAGYGHSTPEGDEATRLARDSAGLALDPTYTAKAFASALWHVRARRAPVILYWHTLSSAPLEPLLVSAPPKASINPHLLALTS